MDQQHNWETAYFKEGFEVLDKEPSNNEKKIIEDLFPCNSALDLGCGHGRIAMFLAEHGCKVDAVDFVDLGVINNIHSRLHGKINFIKCSARDFIYKKNNYDLILMMRLIMYLSEDELASVLRKCAASLKNGGHIFINYTSKGGFVPNIDYSVEKYYYPIEIIKSILEANNLRIIFIRYEKNPARIPLARKREGYYILAGKL